MNDEQHGQQRGELILVATPIGNLGDLSPRAAEALRSADAIACEDTRHTRKLLSAQSITGKRLLAVHEHNEADAAQGIVALVARGQRVALVTDAGTPGISDPGTRVVAAVVAEGLAVSCIPGPVAFISALIISGLATDRFVFEGFLPVKGADRRRRLQAVAGEERTTVLYESPHRILATLTDLHGVCGDERRVSVSRELTKRFEQTWRGRLADAAVAMGEPRGEYVVVIEGALAPPEAEVDLEHVVRAHLATGGRSAVGESTVKRSTRDVADAVVASTGRPRKEVYDMVVRVKREMATGATTTIGDTVPR